jgi:hypothetical protein
MFRREFLTIGSLAAGIFLAVAGAGWWTVRELHETSRMLVVDTIPGLVDTGLAVERMNDNRRVMREMLDPHTASERAQMIQLVRTNSTGPFWRDYATSIFETADRLNYQSTMFVRSNYVQSCENYFNLVSAGKMAEASDLFYGDLSRTFQSYNNAAKKLFAYNVQQGISRGKIILNSARSAPWIIGGLCVLVFVFGIAMGLRMFFSGTRPLRRRPLM